MYVSCHRRVAVSLRIQNSEPTELYLDVLTHSERDPVCLHPVDRDDE